MDDTILVEENIVRRLRERQLKPDPQRPPVLTTVLEATIRHWVIVTLAVFAGPATAKPASRHDDS